MSDFLDQCADDAANVFVTDFAEDIEYFPKGRDAITIKAIVDRNPLQTRGTDGGYRLQYQWEIEFAVSAVVTIKPQEDQVRFPRVYGGTEKTPKLTVSEQINTLHPGLARYGLS